MEELLQTFQILICLLIYDIMKFYFWKAAEEDEDG